MSFGFSVRDSSGILRVWDGNRITRIIGTYVYSGSSATITVPGIVDDGTWGALSRIQTIFIGIVINTGTISVSGGFLYPDGHVGGEILVIRY